MTNMLIYSQGYLNEILLYLTFILFSVMLFATGIWKRMFFNSLLSYWPISKHHDTRAVDRNRIPFARCFLLFDCHVSFASERKRLFISKSQFSRYLTAVDIYTIVKHFQFTPTHSSIIVFHRTWNWESTGNCLVTLTSLPVSILPLTRKQEIVMLFPRVILDTFRKCSILARSKRKGSM